MPKSHPAPTSCLRRDVRPFRKRRRAAGVARNPGRASRQDQDKDHGCNASHGSGGIIIVAWEALVEGAVAVEVDAPALVSVERARSYGVSRCVVGA